MNGTGLSIDLKLFSWFCKPVVLRDGKITVSSSKKYLSINTTIMKIIITFMIVVLIIML